MAYVKSFDGCSIYYEYKKGKKPCLVFLHGISGNCTVWKHQSDFFRRRGHAVLAVDLCGHGRSHKDNHKERYSIDNLARDIDVILQKEKIQDFILIGHSMGGMIALAFDRLYPGRAKGFVLVATPAVNPLKYQIVPYADKATTIMIGSAKAIAWLASKLRRKSYPHIDYSKLGSYNALTILYHDLRCTPADAYFWMAADMFRFDATGHIPNMRQPMLLVTVDMDLAVSKKALEDIHNIAKNAKLKVMKRTDHLNPIRRPHVLSRHILDFVRKNDLSNHTGA